MIFNHIVPIKPGEFLKRLHSLFFFSLLVIPVSLSCSSSPTSIQSSDMDDPHVREAVNVIERSFGEMPSNVILSSLESDAQSDVYQLESDGRTLYVSGTSTIALCRGFYDFILENGYGISSWTGNRLDFPKKIAKVQAREVVSPFEHHLFYNVCTFGYTTPFWDWDRWEEEIDWLALHGFDMPLAPIAGEAILARTWKKLGLPEEGIREYFCGPAHLPWLRMGNMSALDGGMSDEWHQGQIELQHKILDRMEALGMDPVFQGFAGFVPNAVKEVYPQVDLTVTKWQGLESYMLSPLDDLFTVIGSTFIEEWEKEFGKGKYYLIDGFNELEIPFGPKGSKERYESLQHYSQTIYESLAAANPDAVWVMQGWMFGYSRHMWDPESVEALLSGAPDGKMMIIDLAVDFNEYVWRSDNSWDYLSGFYGKEWIWSTVPNFGGRSALKGPLDFYLNGHLEAFQSSNKGRLTGFGTSPEGIENNEIVYELIAKAGWSSEKTDLDGFLKNYTKARYGAVDHRIDEFWNDMRESVYDNFTNNARFLWQQRPAYHRGETMEINESYFEAIEEFLSAYRKFEDNDLYVADAVQYAAFYLAAKADEAFKEAEWAVVAGNQERASEMEALLYDILTDADRLLESHPVFRMERWLDFAKEAGTSELEKAKFVKEAKRLVTTWAGPSLKDYSSRVWSGLIRDFYIPRLKHFFEAAGRGEWTDMAAFENQYHDGIGWDDVSDVALEGEAYVSTAAPFEDPLSAARELVRKYGAVDFENGTCAPDEPIGFWMPQDFTKRKTRTVYYSIMSDDYTGMEGLMFSNVSGNPITVKKVQFRSGHDTLLVLRPDLHLGGEDGSEAVLPVTGPETLDGLEREVKVDVTIEGGPLSYGMISFK